MDRGRLEAFSDAVIAIALTIMVLELRIPHGEDLSALKPMIPAFVTYVLSFINLGIYCNNHHHIFQAAARINGALCGHSGTCCSGSSLTGGSSRS